MAGWYFHTVTQITQFLFGLIALLNYQFSRNKRNIINLISIILPFMLLLTGSRGSAVAIILALVITFSPKKYKNLITSAAFAVLILFIILNFTKFGEQIVLIERIINPQSYDIGAAESRVKEFKYGIDMIKENTMRSLLVWDYQEVRNF